MTRMNMPPVLSVDIEDTMDIMIARDTARRAAGLLGFSTSCKAQLAAAVAALAEVILKAGAEGTIHMNGVRNGSKVGLQISCEAGWLHAMSSHAVEEMHGKLSKMVDEVEVVDQNPPTVSLVFWLLPPRQVKE
ncbi:MAG: hypothetical protein Kow00120_02660 [Anaerolineae bacterium]